jgi:hypothetical protein
VAWKTEGMRVCGVVWCGVVWCLQLVCIVPPCRTQACLSTGQDNQALQVLLLSVQKAEYATCMGGGCTIYYRSVDQGAHRRKACLRTISLRS